jgi:hypothetical protein
MSRVAPGDRGVGHQVDGQGGDVGWVDVPGREQVDPDRGQLQGEVLDQGGLRGRERREQRLARGWAAAGGVAQEHQGPARADRGGSVPGDLQRQQQVGVDVAVGRFQVERRKGRGGGGAGAGDQ